jgi:hypothetical protein
MSRYLQQLSVRPAAAERQRGSPRAREVLFAGLVLRNLEAGWSRQCQAMLAWSALMATTFVIASLLQAVANTALVVPERAAPAATRESATPMSCSVPATGGQACIS